MDDFKVDLHIHTCFSDGVLSPKEIVDRWQMEGYDLIAITDHDGVEGSIVATKYNNAKNRKMSIERSINSLGGLFKKKSLSNQSQSYKPLNIIAGIEFDSHDEDSKDLHILGYGIDTDSAELKIALSDINIMRARRNDMMLKAIQDLGYDISIEDLLEETGDMQFIGKPIFARVLFQKGYFESPYKVFDDLFEVNADLKALVKKTLSTERVIRTIQSAGGVAIMAHPMEQRRADETREEFYPRLKAMLDKFVGFGIDGIECYHPSAREDDSQWLKQYADERELLCTRGSDFHSDVIRKYKLD
ncbi:MAG: PHP domain-containing protein [Clostridiales bacterium]|nr:PHP domain-containing protein [Clostridiales bacterium]